MNLGLGLSLSSSARRRSGGGKPVNITPPSISGTPVQGQTATVVPGTYSGVVTSYTYRWFRNGVVIGGETGTTYLWAAADVGTSNTVGETPHGPGGAGLETVSAAVGPVLPISNLSAWMVAGPTWCFTDAGATTQCGDGDPVYTWVDRSGNARNLTQATLSLRPTLRLVSGKWVVRFDGVDDFMTFATSVTGITGFVAGYLGKKNVAAAVSGGIVLYGSASQDYAFWEDGDQRCYFRVNGGSDAGSDTYDASVRHSTVAARTGSTLSYLVNDVSKGSPSMGTNAASWVGVGTRVPGTGFANVDVEQLVLSNAYADPAELSAYLTGLV